jgi:predicted NBD/HSP70 family sugar kinase
MRNKSTWPTPEASRPAVGPNLLRRMNERRILETVQAEGAVSRADLVRQTGISPPTVSKLVRSLMHARLLEEGDAAEAVPGRPARVLRLAQSGVCVLGAVVDVKECWMAATGMDGRLHADRILRFPTPRSYDALLDTLVQHVRQLTTRGNQATTLALGLSVPGVIDRRRQQVMLSANVHLLDGHFPASDLQERLDIPVVLLHETDATCLGERVFGQARGMDDFVLVDATSGLGAAIMSGGQLVAGHSGLAGEIGHITVEANGRLCGCGNVGCLETVASDLALAELISAKIGKTVSMAQVIELVRAGKLEIDAEIDRTIEYLAIGVATVVNIFNPAAVLVKGRMFDLREGLFEQLLVLVGRRALRPVLADCTILRVSSSKLQSAVAGTIYHLTTVLGPKV